jgi:limonene 1,2-monooxygenase
MRFGLFLQPVHAPNENPTLALERDLQLIELADQFGLHEVWIGEHHSSGWETICSPEIFIAAAAARTKHIVLGSGVVPLSIHNPLFVAENFVLLDHLTRGRMVLGMGAGGGLPSDPRVLGLNGEQQHQRFLQSFAVIQKLLGSLEPISLQTDWFTLHQAVLQLRPFRASGLPLALVTDTNQDTLKLIGQHQTLWLTSLLPEKFAASWQVVESAATAVGKTASRQDVRLAINLHISESREQAIKDIEIGSALERFEFSSAVTGAPLPTLERQQWAAHLATRPTDIVGSVEDAIAKLRQIESQMGGLGGVMIRCKEWTSWQARVKSLELLARYVMPQFDHSLQGLYAAEAVAKQIGKT